MSDEEIEKEEKEFGEIEYDFRDDLSMKCLTNWGPFKLKELIKLMNLTQEDAKGVYRIYGLRYDDRADDLKDKAKKYLNAKYVMENFGLTEEEVKKMIIS